MIYKQLTPEQRYTISILHQRKCTMTDIASSIGVSISTVSRELRRNGSRRGVYKWDVAQRQAMIRRHRAPGNRSISPQIRQLALELLVNRQWSPEQISGYFKRKGIGISHETIYAMIRKDKSGRGIFYKNCRHGLKHRKRYAGKRLAIPDRMSIHLRPIEADGKRFGDFEMDTIVGGNNQGAILTIVERSTNMLFMKKLRHGKDAKELALTVIELLSPYKNIIKSITTDNGPEFFAHKTVASALETCVYFTDPYSSWQKGAIENMNGLIRQYIPKSSSIHDLTNNKIELIRDKINNRPRKKLDFKSPVEVFQNFIA